MIKLKALMILLIILVISALSLAQAPDTSWTRSFGRGSEDYAYTVIQKADDHYIVGGTSWSGGEYQYDAYLLELDEFGDTIWTNSWGGATSEIIYGMVEASDGGYVVAGMVGSETSTRRAYIVKVDELGDTVWSTTYPDSRNAIAYYISNTSDDGYIITGYYFVPGNSADVFILKLAQDGSITWSETFGGSNNDEGYCIKQTTDGGYIVCGRTNSIGEGSTDLYVIKTDAAGTEQWHRTYGGELSDEAHAVVQAPDSNYLIAGEIDNPNHGYYVVKINESGETLWTRIYTHESDIDVCTTMDLTSDGGFILGGYTHVPGQHHDFYFVRANADGDSLWAKTIGYYDNDRGRCIKQTSDGGYILVGSAVDPPDNGTDYFIVKLEDDQVGIEAELISLPKNNSLVQNYPNPFNTSTVISFSVESQQSVLIKLYDTLGREIKTIYNENCEPGYHKFTYDASDMKTGVYFYTIYLDDTAETGKMVLIK